MEQNTLTLDILRNFYKKITTSSNSTIVTSIADALILLNEINSPYIKSIENDLVNVGLSIKPSTSELETKYSFNSPPDKNALLNAISLHIERIQKYNSVTPPVEKSNQTTVTISGTQFTLFHDNKYYLTFFYDEKQTDYIKWNGNHTFIIGMLIGANNYKSARLHTLTKEGEIFVSEWKLSADKLKIVQLDKK